MGDDSKDSIEAKGDNQDLSSNSRTGTSGEYMGTADHDSIHSSQAGDDHSNTEYEIVRSVLYSSRENVNIVHECFRQVRE